MIANPSASTCISTLYAKPNNKILLTHPQGDLDGTFGCLRAWVQKLARLHLPVVVNEMAEKHHVEVKKLIIRTQKTRWGSYSNSGTMSLNSKLMFLEKQYVELVILHEMAHMTYHDHSQKFWAHLVSFEPHALELDKHLNKLAREIPVWMHELA